MDYSLCWCLELGALFLNSKLKQLFSKLFWYQTTLRLEEERKHKDFDSWPFSPRKFDGSAISQAVSRKFPGSFRNDSRCSAQLRSWWWGLVADITLQSFQSGLLWTSWVWALDWLQLACSQEYQGHSGLHQNSWRISCVAFYAALTGAWPVDESCLFFFAGISSLGRLLHLHRNDRVPAQGELPLPGLSQPGLQQKGGRPTERNVPLWEVRQRVSQLQVPPYPLCKWLFSVFLIPYSPTNTPAQSYVNIPGVKA